MYFDFGTLYNAKVKIRSLSTCFLGAGGSVEQLIPSRDITLQKRTSK